MFEFHGKKPFWVRWRNTTAAIFIKQKLFSAHDSQGIMRIIAAAVKRRTIQQGGMH